MYSYESLNSLYALCTAKEIKSLDVSVHDETSRDEEGNSQGEGMINT